VATSTILPTAEPIRAVAAQIRDEFSSFDRLMNDVFADVEQLRDQLQLRMAEVDDAKARLAERGRQLAEQRKESGRLTHQLEQQEARLDAAIDELRQLRSQIDQERIAANEREARHHETTLQQLSLLNAERERLLGRVMELECRSREASTGEHGAAAGVALSDESLLAVLSQLEAVRQDVQSTRTELADAVGRVAVVSSDGAGNSPSSNQFQDLQAQLEQLRQEQRTLEKSHSEVLRERDRLEGELELVRTRACELQEVVSEQQDLLSQQHDDVSDELRQLKSVIESQFTSLSRKSQPFERIVPAAVDAQAAAPPPNVTVAHANVNAADAPPADPVVNSVMAQFARLQKDVALRRKKK
jgi:predicted  nucleic acid-binding Zn-ribbon protein